MKRNFKFLLLSLLVAALIIPFALAADTGENEAGLPSEWVDQINALHPDSDSAIKAKYPDIPDNWSTNALINAVRNGLLNGSNGYILPQENLTRAQLAAILSRAFGATDKADISAFKDILPEKWYYDDMAKSVKMGIFKGDGAGKLRPDDTITRQEVFTVISRAFAITGSDVKTLDAFPDAIDIADWAADASASLVAQKYIQGSNGHLNPLSPMTRAEFAQMMMNLVDSYITESGVYTTLPEGNIVIRSSGVVIKDITLKGDIFVGEGVGNAITFTNVTSPFRTVIRGGKSVVLNGTYENVIVVNGGITVDAKNATIKMHKIFDSTSKLNLDPSVETPSSGSNTGIEGGGNGGSITGNGDSDKITIKGDDNVTDPGIGDGWDDGQTPPPAGGGDTSNPNPNDPNYVDKDGDGWIDGWF